MTYEVYIDVRHHPRHLDDWEERCGTAFKLVKPESATPSDAERMRAVAYSLREYADQIDPDWHCTNCNLTRGEHVRKGNLYQCFGEDGPITQWQWWAEIREAIG